MNYYKAFTASDETVLNFYINCYKGIQLANSVIAYSKTTAESDVRARYTDEARFIRAYYYLILVQQFGSVPLTTDMYSSAKMNFERTSLKEIYQFIIDEFTYLSGSSSNLQDRTASGVGRANKQAALFFLAKAYLTRAWLNGKDYESLEENIAQSTDFSNAAKYALQAINSEIPSISIEKAFSIDNEENAEIFWSVQFSAATMNDPSAEGSCQQAQFGSYLGGSECPLNKAIDGNMSPALRLIQMYTKGDGRLEQTFMLELHGDSKKNGYFNYYTAPTSSPICVYYAPAWATDEDISTWKNNDPNNIKSGAIISKSIAEGGIAPLSNQIESYKVRRSMGYGVPCIKKFDDYTSMANRSTTCSTHDVVVARLGEAYLVAAEAYLGMGDKVNAALMINSLRKRPGTIKTGFETSMTVSPSDITIDFILDERARELAGEYVRWMDLKRTHKLIEYVTKYNEDGVTDTDMKGADGNYKFLRPIPQDAMDKNQTKVSQNPGF